MSSIDAHRSAASCVSVMFGAICAAPGDHVARVSLSRAGAARVYARALGARLRSLGRGQRVSARPLGVCDRGRRAPYPVVCSRRSLCLCVSGYNTRARSLCDVLWAVDGVANSRERPAFVCARCAESSDDEDDPQANYPGKATTSAPMPPTRSKGRPPGRAETWAKQCVLLQQCGDTVCARRVVLRLAAGLAPHARGTCPPRARCAARPVQTSLASC